MSIKYMASPALLALSHINISSDFRAASYNESSLKKDDKNLAIVLGCYAFPCSDGVEIGIMHGISFDVYSALARLNPTTY